MSSEQLRFDNKVVVVTGAGGGLGKAYALFFGTRGASVVVNDLGGARPGESLRAADLVVKEIESNGGKAVANYDSVEFGEKIIETAVNAFGTVHVLINNAGILRDKAFKNMTKEEFEFVYKVHVQGAYKVTHAAWPLFRNQNYGRIINTASAAGLYGNFGQANYSAAKMALVGFSETLAKEGAKYNIIVNAIAPIAGTAMTATIMPEEVVKNLKPEFVTPLVALLTHESNTESGGIYELGAGFYSKIRWERSNGVLFKADSSFTPSAILKRWEEITDFTNTPPEHPEGLADFVSLSEQSQKLEAANPQGPEISFKDQVVVVTGAGAGIGRCYALLFGKLGAKVVVNDFANPDDVVEIIRKAGGTAVGDKSNVVDGAKVIETAVKAFGTVHVVVNNAGILRDKSFLKMDEKAWNDVLNVHLFGTYAVTKAAWPYFLKQKYGRVLNTSSTSGIYGNFGQANYAAAKCGIIGFTKTLAVEGAKNNIIANVIAPNAGTAMTATILPEELVELFKPEYIAPLVALLSSDKAPISGGLFETGSGWIGQTRLQRTGGYGFPITKEITPELVMSKWSVITDFDNGRANNPNSPAESGALIMENMTNQSSDDEVNAAGQKGFSDEAIDYSYTSRDLILYNLGLGAKASELQYVYENNENFSVVPTFGVIPTMKGVIVDFGALVPNFNPMMLLHGEQYLEIRQWPIPEEATLINESKIIEVIDKGKAAIVVYGTTTKDKSDGKELFYNEGTVFIRGSGGFGGSTTSKDRGAATATNNVPARRPDLVKEIKTSEEQAAIYRLSGDFNPLHIDPDFAAAGNFPKPILHGLCTFGISGKVLFEEYGVFKNIKVRFTGVVYPGETLRVEAWKESSRKVIFQTTVVERNSVAIASAAVELEPKVGGSKL
ncbi:multifunctional beta-oxidation enzyme [Nadsonia fulvescens var. elongata DSM 6958]|uniref:Multifunctional beta-oxidation enzyme n=1 Tax=Nadsonia fulvescens var. elongata DSM 6958 TaxID=857566 RepID=A0A1E3PDQ2_9ASCO|nr:multifunctional beta-oxidation enzyme [Nadsonia fulvescens var. elongata DSM 6958]